MKVRSVSFDTSFLLKDDSDVDVVIKALSRDLIPCFVTTTVVSELEQLRIWGRISNNIHKHATRRWKRAHATLIDFKNRFFSSTFGKQCILSMKQHHGVEPKDIANDCNILVSALKNGVDLFLSEDFHFTSKITIEVIDEIKNAACREYNQMCNSFMYSIDTKTFLEAYDKGIINIDIVNSRLKDIRKNSKVLRKNNY
jgi:hypothetical protein